jgi:hypothetical protein
MADYLIGLDAGKPVTVLTGGPEIGGRFFYTDDMDGPEFPPSFRAAGRGAGRPAVVPRGRRAAGPGRAVGRRPIRLARLRGRQSRAAARRSVAPRIWIGNAITTATHFDMNYNIACAVAGRRRFTLFPPDQLKNLYLGPLEFTPAGPPVSMVDIARPTWNAFPGSRRPGPSPRSPSWSRATRSTSPISGSTMSSRSIRSRCW